MVRASYDWSQALDRRDCLGDSPVVIVYLDLASHQREKQNPLEPWDRALHTRLIDRLTRARAKAVVFDIIFDSAGRNPQVDRQLADAMRANGHVVLAGELPSFSQVNARSGIQGLAVIRPAKLFIDAAAGWGIANVAVDEDYVVRRIFRGFENLQLPSLVGAAATVVGATNAGANEGEWVKYYGAPLTVPHVSYSSALRPEETPDDVFRDKIVFVGARPAAGLFGERKDEFRSPLASWGAKDLFMPAVETHATQLINIVRGDALRRLSPAQEALVLALCAALLTAAMFLARPAPAAGLAVACELAALGVVVFVLPGLWFPWLIVCAVQIPTAFAGSALFQTLEWYRQKRQFQARIHEQAALIEKAQDAIMTFDLQGRLTYANPSARRLYGPAMSDAAPEPALAAARETGEWLVELTQKAADGREIVVASRCTLIKDASGAAKSYLFINTDITEKKRLEAEFLRAQRLESVGALAAGMAHDLNNALAPVLMGVQLLQRQRQDEETQRMLSVMEQNTHRGADMVRQVLLFSRGGGDEKQPLSVGALVRDMERIARQTFPKSIDIAALAPSDLWPVLGNVTQLHQALLNLCVNARDAMPEGGHLTLAADNIELTEKEAQEIPGATAGPFVMLLVSDTGCGIAQNALRRLFEPFFTTKPVGQGTGLGLYTSARIIRQHGGFLHARSEVGRGSSFEIYLPCATITPLPPAEPASRTTPSGHGEWILVVDDEESVREMISLTLSAHGYQTIGAANGAEAVAVFSQRTDIALALLDSDMPALSGAQTAPILRARIPGLPIILMSGKVADDEPDGLARLAKPFSVEELIAAVAAQLAK